MTIELSWDLISQLGIIVFGVTAIVLVARKNKWGFVCGVASQPFWYITSYTHRQWGVFAVSFVYSASWIYGIYGWFFKEKLQARARRSRQEDTSTQ